MQIKGRRVDKDTTILKKENHISPSTVAKNCVLLWIGQNIGFELRCSDFNAINRICALPIESQSCETTPLAIYELLLQKTAANQCVVTCSKVIALRFASTLFCPKIFGPWSGTPFMIVFPTENFRTTGLPVELAGWSVLWQKTVPKIRQLTARIWFRATCLQHGHA